MTLTHKKTFINMPLLAISMLGFSSGLPLALTGSTLQAWFTEAHINLVTIGILSLLGLPYTLKFIWAPLMDFYSFPNVGKRKGWIIITQVGLIVSLLFLAHMNPATEAVKMGILAFVIAFFSASQDISINAYQTEILPKEELGLGVAYYVFAYRIAALISGGAALVCADFLGWRMTYEIMAVLMFIALLLTVKIPKPQEILSLPANLLQTTVISFMDLWRREKIILLLAFIFLYKLGDALALSLMTNFLLHGLHFSLTEVGLAYKVVSLIAMVLGGFVGGVILTRFNIYRALLVFGLAQAFSNLMFAVLAMVGKHFLFMSISIFIENFCSGLSTAALLAFMMSLCNHRYTASQFALLSAVASLGRVFLGPVAAVVVNNVGWTQFYIWSFILCLPSILLLQFLKAKGFSHVQATAE